jgi:hypothetical protein
MPESNSYKTPTPDPNTPEYQQLSLYLDAISSEKRLQILRYIERDAKDIKTLSAITETSPENTTKHVDKMMLVGLVKYGPAKKNSRGQPVKTYILVPGSYEAILRTLSHFSYREFDLTPRIRQLEAQISKIYPLDHPHIKLIGGINDGLVFPLTLYPNHEVIRLGRLDPLIEKKEGDIVIDNSYRIVTRVSQPHARISFNNGQYLIEDCQSKWGTYLNSRKLIQFRQVQLHNNDSIELGNTSEGAHFIVYLPEPEVQDSSG